MKWDGVRTVAYLAGGRVRLLSRKGRDDTAAYFDVVDDLAAVPVQTAVLDGEVVVTDEAGRPNFGLLQHRINLTRPGDIERAARTWPAQLMLFDILHLDGQSLVKKPYAERRAILEDLVRPADGIAGPGAADLRRALGGGTGHQPGTAAGGGGGQATGLGLPAGPAGPYLAQDEAAPDPGGGDRRLAARPGSPGGWRRRAADGHPHAGGAALRRPGRLRFQRPDAG